jgi:hypothetical protein
MNTKKPPKSEKYVDAPYLHDPIDVICAPVESASKRRDRIRREKETARILKQEKGEKKTRDEDPNKVILSQIARLESPQDWHNDNMLTYQDSGYYMPAWSTEGDRRISQLLCMLARIVRHAGTWMTKKSLSESMMAQIDAADKIALVRSVLEEEGFFRINEAHARYLFGRAMRDAGIDISRYGSEKLINQIWQNACNLPWDGDCSDDPIVGWLRSVCEVSQSTRHSAVATAELVSMWRKSYSSDNRTDLGIARSISSGIAEAWPQEIKSRALRSSNHIHWTNKNGYAASVRGWMGIAVTDSYTVCLGKNDHRSNNHYRSICPPTRD